MNTSGVQPSSWTKSLIIRYLGHKSDIKSALALITSEPDDSITSHMLTNAISLSPDVETATKLFNRAVKLQLLDETVFTSTAQLYLKYNHYRLAISTLRNMLDRNYRINKYSLSVLINAFIKWQNFENNETVAVTELYRYLQNVREENPELFYAESY